MAVPNPAPQKRYRLHLELDAHTLEDALRELQVLVNDAHTDGLPPERVSSAGYHLRWNEVEGYTPEAEYMAAVSQWLHDVKYPKEAE